MKQKITLTLTICVALFLASASPVNAFFKSDVKKAKEFMQAGMYPQAISLLEKAISDAPANPEPHFQMGICYINTGNYSGADERFSSAIKLKPDYGYKIGAEYRKAGSDRLNNGRTRQARSLFQKAVQFQPKLKKEIAKECFAAGKSYLNKHQSSPADGLLSMACSYDPSLMEQIKAVQVNYGHNLLKIAKAKPKEHRKKYIDEAKKYLSQKDIDAVFPPPTWKTVFSKTYTGVGYTGGDDPKYNDGGIWTAKSGKDVFVGDRVTVIDADFEIWINGGWAKYPKGHRVPVKRIKPGHHTTFRIEKGKGFTVVVERFME